MMDGGGWRSRLVGWAVANVERQRARGKAATGVGCLLEEVSDFATGLVFIFVFSRNYTGGGKTSDV